MRKCSIMAARITWVFMALGLAADPWLVNPSSHADDRQRDAQPGRPAAAVVEDWGDPETMDRPQVIERTMRPFHGVSHPGVDPRTLNGKVMCGYQGWFAAEGDGAGRGWVHWTSRNRFEPGRCKIDLWPDVSELDQDERFATPFRHADGRPADVFSSFNRKTVLRHFQWMKDSGIDGVFVQRFINDVSHPKGLRHVNVVLNHCREGANLHGRTYAVMYDLSGLGGGQMQRVMDDWKLLIDRMRITQDPAYLHHNGKPVVTVWGFGFNDRRRYTPKEGLELLKFLKDDPRYGCTVMLGVPTYWRTLEARLRQGSESPRADPQRRYRQSLDGREILHPATGKGVCPEDDEARSPMVPGTRQAIHARRLPRLQLAQHGPSIAPRSDPSTEREVPLDAVRAGQESRCDHGLPGDVRRGQRGNRHLQVHQ